MTLSPRKTIIVSTTPQKIDRRELRKYKIDIRYVSREEYDGVIHFLQDLGEKVHSVTVVGSNFRKRHSIVYSTHTNAWVGNGSSFDGPNISIEDFKRQFSTPTISVIYEQE